MTILAQVWDRKAGGAKEASLVRVETVLVVDGTPDVRVTFIRQTAARLASAGAVFAVLLGVQLWLLPVDAVSAWMRQAPLAVVLAAASLGAARLARWWAETEREGQHVALALHSAFQAVVLAP